MSEGLKALKILKGETPNQIVMCIGRQVGKQQYANAIKIIEKELKKGEKYKKAFERLKKKYGFRVCKNKFLAARFYNDNDIYFILPPQEEYELLKEVFEIE